MEKYLDFPIKKIIRKDNVRWGIRDKEDKRIKELSESMRHSGLLEPIVLRENGSEGKANLIAGSRRLRAAELLEWDTIPAIVQKRGGLSEKEDKYDRLNLSTQENTNRENLSFSEIGRSARILVEEGGYTIPELSVRFGISESTIKYALKTLDGAEDFIDKVDFGGSKGRSGKVSGKMSLSAFKKFKTVVRQARPSISEEGKKTLFEVARKYNYGSYKLTLIWELVRRKYSIASALKAVKQGLFRYIRVPVILPKWFLEKYKDYPGGYWAAVRAIVYGKLPPIKDVDFTNITGL